MSLTSKAYSIACEAGPQKPVWLSVSDVQKQTAGIQKERCWLIGSATVQEVIAGHGKARAAQWKNGQFRFAGHCFKVWDSYGISTYPFRAGSFSEDSRGHWYFNICVQVECATTTATGSVRADLGLKDAVNGRAACSGAFLSGS